MLIKCTIFYTKRCMYEQKWEYSYKETPVQANAGSGVFLIKGFFLQPLPVIHSNVSVYKVLYGR